jgi:phage-related protein
MGRTIDTTATKESTVESTNFVAKIWNGITYAASKVWDGICYLASKAKDGVVYVGTKAKDGIRYLATKAWDGIRYVAIKTKDVAVYVGTKAWDGIRYVCSKAKDGVVYVGTKAWDGIKAIGRWIKIAAVKTRDTAVAFAKELAARAGDLWRAFVDAINAIWQFLTGWLRAGESAKAKVDEAAQPA